MTFKQIIDEAAEAIGNLQPEARVRYRRYLNEWYRRITADTPLPRGGETTLSIVAGTDLYSLGATTGRLRSLQDETNGTLLVERPLAWIRAINPHDNATGLPQYFAYVSTRQIKLYPNPSANGMLTVDHEVTITELDDDTDVPILPEDFHWLLKVGIQLNEARKLKDYDAVKDLQGDLARGVLSLRHWIASRQSHVLNPGRWLDSGAASRLGAWYPRNS